MQYALWSINIMMNNSDMYNSPYFSWLKETEEPGVNLDWQVSKRCALMLSVSEISLWHNAFEQLGLKNKHSNSVNKVIYQSPQFIFTSDLQKQVLTAPCRDEVTEYQLHSL